MKTFSKIFGKLLNCPDAKGTAESKKLQSKIYKLKSKKLQTKTN